MARSPGLPVSLSQVQALKLTQTSTLARAARGTPGDDHDEAKGWLRGCPPSAPWSPSSASARPRPQNSVGRTRRAAAVWHAPPRGAAAFGQLPGTLRLSTCAVQAGGRLRVVFSSSLTEATTKALHQCWERRPILRLAGEACELTRAAFRLSHPRWRPKCGNSSAAHAATDPRA